MIFQAFSSCLKSALSKGLLSINSKSRILFNQRSVYTFPAVTDIPILDRNRAAFVEKYTENYLPSWLENCPHISQEEMDALYSAFPAFADDLEALECSAFPHMKPGAVRARQYIEHTLPWMPYIAAQMLVVNRFYMERAAKKNRPIANTEDYMKKVHKTAWCLESMVRFEFQLDDAIDISEARNGLESWIMKPEIGLEGMYDMSSALTGGYLLLHKYFSHEEYFLEMSKFIMEMLHVTQVAPVSLSSLKPKPRHLWENEAMERKTFEHFVNCKRDANATLILNVSVMLPMIMHGVNDPGLRDLVMEMGRKVCDCIVLIDDLIDYQGNIHVSQRVGGTDIRWGRQTWLLWKAMELGSEEQCNRLTKNYGRDDEKCENEVKKVFEELKVVPLLKDLAQGTYNTLRKDIDALPHEDVPSCLYTYLMDHYVSCIKGKAARV